MITDSLNFLIVAWGGIPKLFQHAWRVFSERRVLMIIFRTTMPIENVRGCLSCHVFRDIEEKNVFSLIEEWETREDLDDHLKSDRFSVLLGTKSLLCEPLQIEIHTVSHTEGMETVKAARGIGT
jgi:quinol monooxygenase YgiN